MDNILYYIVSGVGLDIADKASEYNLNSLCKHNEDVITESSDGYKYDCVKYEEQEFHCSQLYTGIVQYMPDVWEDWAVSSLVKY
jgi:hypothetical protein